MASQTPLKAQYASPSSQKAFEHTLPNLPADQTQEHISNKTAYLSALRAGCSKIQDDVNAFLTLRMEENKANYTSKGTTADEKAEAMYGEEEVEDES